MASTDDDLAAVVVLLAVVEEPEVVFLALVVEGVLHLGVLGREVSLDAILESVFG